jgi:(2R)-3-sulfolactate dehydrogenase (NADP+)
VTRSVTLGEARSAAIRACCARGASPEAAAALAEAAISAEWAGRPEMGFAHLLDYLDALAAGRIDGRAQPKVTAPLPALISVDADGGIVQLGFTQALPQFIAATRNCGIALLAAHNAYTAGELGYYVRALAQAGLVAMAFANAHAMMAPAADRPKVYGTNPLAFAAPRGQGRQPLVLDQATSATAFVNLLHAAQQGQSIPPDWATDERGAATTDPVRAMLGALLPAGGRKGANLALLVEVMAAGLSGASWSLDAGHFREGGACPRTGLTIIAVAADALDPDFAARLDRQLDRLGDMGVHIPGAAAQPVPADDQTLLEVDPAVWTAILAAANTLDPI